MVPVMMIGCWVIKVMENFDIKDQRPELGRWNKTICLQHLPGLHSLGYLYAARGQGTFLQLQFFLYAQ